MSLLGKIARVSKGGTLSERDARTAAGTVITFGTFDMLHVGHVSILERAAAFGDRLVVGVSTDALTVAKKGRPPFFGEQDRLRIVGALRVVDETFLEHSLEDKARYAERYGATTLVMGDDWRGAFDWLQPAVRVVYLERTPDVCSSGLAGQLRGAAGPAAETA